MFADIPLYKKGFHLLPVVFVYGVILSIILSVTVYYMLDERANLLGRIFFGFIFYSLAAMVLITHTKSMFTTPGYVSKNYKPSNVDRNDKQLYCKKCQYPRPPRAHHCKICRKCTLKMDHHCPWIGNCVGVYNQKYFYQFLFYATLGDLVGFLILVTRLLYIDMSIQSNINADKSNPKVIDSPLEILLLFTTPLLIILSSCLALAMTVAIGLLFCIQTKMILENSTSIENKLFSEDITRSPYYFPDKLHNFRIVMGNSLIEWMMPFSFAESDYNSGYTFYTPKNIPRNIVPSTNYQKLRELELPDGFGML